tara:strand:+ start:4233 stop:4619 length:387 start_codon:yes stop_codon:yes gene_type:complete
MKKLLLVGILSVFCIVPLASAQAHDSHVKPNFAYKQNKHGIHGQPQHKHQAQKKHHNAQVPQRHYKQPKKHYNHHAYQPQPRYVYTRYVYPDGRYVYYRTPYPQRYEHAPQHRSTLDSTIFGLFFSNH